MFENINTLYKKYDVSSYQVSSSAKKKLPTNLLVRLFATSPPEKNELLLLPCKRAGKMSK